MSVVPLAARCGKSGEWVMENGELSAKGHGTQWTRESYGNFILVDVKE